MQNLRVSGPQPDTLIIAAPIKTPTLSEWLELNQLSLQNLIDLREDRGSFTLQASAVSITDLQSFFNQFSQADLKATEVRGVAMDFIRKRAQYRGERIEHRPFGWDDLCA